MKTAKEFIAEYDWRKSAYVVKGIISGMFVDINGLFERDIEQAQAFSSYEEAEKYIKNSAYPSLLKPVKYVPSAVEIDEENEDADTDNDNNSDFHKCSSEINCDNDMAYDFWKETRE